MSNLRNTMNHVNQSIITCFGKAIIDSTNFQTIRTFSRSNRLAKSKTFYDDLEIPKTATQSEIKSAYYTLSLIYHPDKNKTGEANDKFRRITEAYEVLGNFRTRRMYDKGIGSFTRNNASTSSDYETEILHEEVEDDAQTRFYKQHMVRSQPPAMSDRMTARDFYQWSANQITSTFQRKQRAKKLMENRLDDIRLAKERSNLMTTIFVFLILIFCCIAIYEFQFNNQDKRNQKKS